jgi:hypothetical protein
MTIEANSVHAKIITFCTTENTQERKRERGTNFLLCNGIGDIDIYQTS